ncbi:response regulator [Sporomusa acidovorans]|jgi:Response regulator containing CheY-like receiver domain and AraC-type DNA-binding domain|uniref:Chemotaxis protein CheY n=1 Tax=Sporomusa acidovorans (strain ATCC 49682 / DSM 3132 / Mol) TaxID=1123286 RepID=A0ABZ3J4K1_SPOA4|nr:response regulator [Sporomusa acidovorans]OZC23088.1 chemotaxis protein CheY [Sporomusa acidovorans DSM 3132]SDF05067.1 two-component system, chemotaxis family, response regulator CheY [Sporomusa acidovorans]
MSRILICDDSAFMRMMLKKMITDLGHEVVAEAGDGKQAVQLYRQFTPDLVTMDITMPVMDGIQAVKHIHEEDPLARIIMVTAIGQRSIISDAIKAGASSFIVKPFDPEQVEETINKVLAG